MDIMKDRKPRTFFGALLLAGCCFLGSLAPVAVSAQESAALTKYGMLPIYGRDIQDGAYRIDVQSASGEFQIEAAVLTVSGDELTVELALMGADCAALFPGTAGEAKDSADNIAPVDDIYIFPITALDQAIPCAFYSQEQAAWQDNLLLFDASSLPEVALLLELPDYDLIAVALESLEDANAKNERPVFEPVEPVNVDLADGEYAVSVDMTGGSGKASVTSPTIMLVQDGKAYARLQWSSANYDYMIVGTETYYNQSPEGVNSVFVVPIGCWDQEMTVIADTTAMGTPYEVQYTLTFYLESIDGKGTLPQEAAKRVILLAMIIIVGGGILNHFVQKRRRK